MLYSIRMKKFIKKYFPALLLTSSLLLFSPKIADALIPLSVNQGGTGVSTITGIIQGNGTTPFSPIVVGSGLDFTSGTLSVIGSVDDNVLATDAATTAALAGTPTYNNGTAGVGATLTRTGNGALPNQDAINLIVGERLLVKNQATQLQNGIYSVTVKGDASNPYVLTRTTDSDQTSELDGQIASPARGTVNRGRLFAQQTNAPVIGTDAIVYIQTSTFVTQQNTGTQTQYQIPVLTGTLRQITRGTQGLTYDYTNKIFAVNADDDGVYEILNNLSHSGAVGITRSNHESGVNFSVNDSNASVAQLSAYNDNSAFQTYLQLQSDDTSTYARLNSLGLITIGDVQGLGNSSKIVIDDSDPSILLQTLDGVVNIRAGGINLNSADGDTEIGDTNSVGNNTRIGVFDSSKTIVLTATGLSTGVTPLVLSNINSSTTVLGAASKVLAVDGSGQVGLYTPEITIGTPVAGTPGSVLFIDGSGDLGQDNTRFFWDDTNFHLNIAGNIILTQNSSTSLAGFNIDNTLVSWTNAVTTGGLGNMNVYSNWSVTTNTQSDVTKPSWVLRLRTDNDVTQFLRVPAGGAEAVLWTLNGSGFMGVGNPVSSPTAYVDISPSTTAAASLRLEAGTAPTSPNAGDVWTTTTHMFVRLNGTTYQLDQQTGSGTVTSVSVVSANGFAGTVATATTTPAITLSTTITGILKGNGTAISAAVANTDYTPAVMTTGGDIIYGGASGVATRLANGSAGQVLQSNGTTLAPTWVTPTSGTVTSVSGTANRITSTGGATPVIDISASYVGQTSLTTLGTITTGIWNGTKVGLAYGGTNADLSGTGGTGQYLKQSSVGAAITVGTIPASDIGSGAALTKTDDTNVTLTLGGTPSTSLLAATSLTLGWTGTLSGTRGGTGVNNGASTITLGGNLTTSGAFATTLTSTATTNSTLPAGTHTLAGLDVAQTWTAKQTFQLATTPMQIGFDASNFMTITPDSVGNTTFALTGTTPQFAFSQGVTITGIMVATGTIALNTNTRVFRTTNGGSNISANIMEDFGGSASIAGSPALALDATNGLVLTAANGTRRIARAGINLTNLVNTAGSESADLVFTTERSAGAAIATSMTLTSGGNLTLAGGNFTLGTAGNGLLIKEGSNATMGTCTLVLGTCTVSTTKVTASSRIFLTVQSLGTVAVATPISVTARSAGTSFTVTSSSATDTSVIAWVIIEPAP